MKALRRCLALFLIATSAGAAEIALPSDSIYWLDATLSDQSGVTAPLSARRGKPQLVALFYTSCKFVCPLIIDSAKGVERGLDPREREALNVLLVSLDPARDDTAALASVARKRRLDPAHWTLARTDDGSVRKLAALLGVRYRALDDGEFNHTSALYLIDAEGRKVASTSQLGPVPDPEFLTQVRAALSPRP
ncbi:SCO family protein [Tahibacter amnicola]|uniref:SCO family protein n=1 Tax=Tahibacter amnicola TaxID=2976241 RepID=A0ABY6BD93_9GAMM|nr:SCO family protein [Tahibacter amnicola]UXI66581.1 SCO family protein [Tahibacter amnicola]